MEVTPYFLQLHLLVVGMALEALTQLDSRHRQTQSVAMVVQVVVVVGKVWVAPVIHQLRLHRKAIMVARPFLQEHILVGKVVAALVQLEQMVIMPFLIMVQVEEVAQQPL
jgi:hypothetical protein